MAYFIEVDGLVMSRYLTSARALRGVGVKNRSSQHSLTSSGKKLEFSIENYRSIAKQTNLICRPSERSERGL